jgi:hypothetical protein
MLCDALTLSEFNEHVAVLFVLSFCVSVLSFPPVQVSVVAPSWNVTVPVGWVWPEVPVTVAVNVSDVPYVTDAEPAVRASVIEGPAVLTVCETVFDGPAAT